MHHIDRRSFLRQTAVSVVSLGVTVPLWLRTAHATLETADDRYLVLIQLTGGNDALNTVVPYHHDEYYRRRPGLALRPAELIRLDERFGLHPSLSTWEPLWKEGDLAIIHGVGYPQPDRSHFRSLDIWHTADPQVHTPRTGWLGRAVDFQSEHHPELSWQAAALGMNRLPAALLAERAVCPVIRDGQEYQLHQPLPSALHPLRTSIGQQLLTEPTPDSRLQQLRRMACMSLETATRLARLAQEPSRAEYPSHTLARHLQVVAQLIHTGFSARVYLVAQDGYDTHALQLPGHAVLLRELAESVAAFVRDLSQRGLRSRVLIATYSEFGRRVEENGSLGTDHGAAAAQFMLLPGHGGMYGEPPSLTELDDGDLRHTIDFRRLYATWLQGWLRIPAHPILKGEYAPLLQV